MPNLITLGSEVKMHDSVDGKRVVEGHLVLFGSPDEADFVGDYFTKATDFDLDGGTGKATMYFNHGLDPVLKTHKLNHGIKAELSIKDKSVWIQGLLDEANEYDAMVIDLMEQRQSRGKSVGWSSGVPSHLVEKHEIKSGIYEITKWSLGSDASLTHTPADYRNKATYKTIEMLPINTVLNASDATNLDEPEAVQAKGSNGDTHTSDDTHSTQISFRGDNMSDDTQKKTPAQSDNDQLNQIIDGKVQAGMKSLDGKLSEYRGEVKGMSDAIGKLLQQMEDSPTIRKSGYFTADGGTADKDVKSFGDWLMAVKRKDDVRLTSVYGSTHMKAQSGDSGGLGGYLIPEEFGDQFLNAIMRSSPIVNGVTRQQVSVRSGRFPSLDLATAPTAGGGESAEQSGVGTNVRAEGGAYTEETANFDQILFNVSDAASGHVKVSCELTQEVAGMESLLRNLITRGQTEKIERLILLGSGASQPLGILNGDCLISLTVDTSDSFVLADMSEMISRFKPMFSQTDDNQISGGAWLMHRSMLPDIYALETGTGGSVWNTNVSQGPTMVLDGRPIIFSEHLAQANSSGALLLAELASYILFELGGMYIDYSEHADFTNGNDVWRYGARIDGKPWLNSEITLAGPGSAYTVSPFVKMDD
jgi:HK97 family phage major capsid protein